MKKNWDTLHSQFIYYCIKRDSNCFLKPRKVMKTLTSLSFLSCCILFASRCALPPVLFWYLMKQEKTSESYQSIKDKLCNNLERKGGRRSFHEYTVNLYANHDWLMFSCVGHNLVRCRTWTNAKDSLYFLKPQWGFSSSYTCLLTHCVKSPIFGPKMEFWRNLVQII